MDRGLALTKYIVLVGVFGLILGSLTAFLLATVETGELVFGVFSHIADPTLEIQEVYFIRLVDGFLVATGLLIFGLGLYEIFIRQLDLPLALRFTTIGQLKSSLANIIILTLAVTFLSSLQENESALSVLLKGLGTAAVIAVLVFFTRGSSREDH